MIIALYINDLILSSNSLDLLSKVKATLKNLKMYAMIRTRQDIAVVLSELSKYVSNPVKNCLFAAKRGLRYFQFQKDHHLQFSR